MSKMHYFDLDGDLKVPNWEENKRNGYKIAACGYQRKNNERCELRYEICQFKNRKRIRFSSIS